MTIVTGDRYLDLLSTFIEENTGPLLDGVLLLKLNPVGLHYVQTRLEALEELEALRVGAPVDYLRAYIADLGDHRALEQLRRVLRLLSSVKVVAMVPPPSRDPTPITLLPFSRLRFLELRGCDLSTTAARGLLELRPILEKLVCFNSADALRHIFSERTKEIQGAPVWSRLADVSCFGNGMLLMDESLQLLPAIEALDLSRNRFARLANLQKCTKLKYLDAGYNNITTVASLNKILRSVTRLVLRNNALVSTRGLHRVTSLEALDLSYNLISNLCEVELLGELPSLRFLWLEGNPITFGRWYRREALSYFPDPMKLVLDGKQTSMWESWVARRIAARRLKQRSKYGAFTPAETCGSSDLSPLLSDSENLDETTDRADSSISAGPSSGSSALRTRKKNSRLASIIDVTGIKDVPRTIESPRGSPSNPLASLDSGSPVQSVGESKEQIEETVQDLIQRAEVLKRAGSTCWLKDLNSLLESEGKSKSQMPAKMDTSRQSSLLKRRRRRSLRKESLGEPSTSDRSNLSEAHEETQTNVARLTRESSSRRMGKDALARLGSGYSVDDEHLKAVNLSASTSLEDLHGPFLDGDEPPSSVGTPDNSNDGVGLKLGESSGKSILTEGLLTGTMSVGSSSSPPQFNQALLRRRETLERELLLLPPERDISPLSDSDSSSGTIYSHLSDSSDSPIHSASAVWHPYRFDHGQITEIPSAQGEESDSEYTFQVWSDTEAQDGEALERAGLDVRNSTGVVHSDEVAQHNGNARASTEHTAKGNVPGIEDSTLPVHPRERKEIVIDQGKDAVEDDTALIVDSRGQMEADEAGSGQCEISSSSIKVGPMLQLKAGSKKEKREGDEMQIYRGRTSMLQPRSKSSRRVVHIKSLSGITDSSGAIEASSKGSYGRGNELHRATSLDVNEVPGRVLEKSSSSSVRFSNPFNISRSSSADANLERQREWSRGRSKEDVLASTSLPQGESHESADSSLQCHRVHHLVGPFVGQCV